MKQGYIQSINSVAEFQKIVKAMNEVGVDSNNIFINSSFNSFIKGLSSGDCVVVSNLEFFNSMSELMDATILLTQSGVHMLSLADSWYNVSPDMATMLVGINAFGKRVRASRTRDGLRRAKAQGKVLGRPLGSSKIGNKIIAINKLRAESKISIAQACEAVKCNPRTYYRHVNREQTVLKK